MNHPCHPGGCRDEISRRGFLWRAGSGLAVSLLGVPPPACADATDAAEVVVFSKILQELNASLETTAEITAEAGLDGVDCPVRPGGQILPERAAEELPRFSEILKTLRLRIPLLTTAITGISSPYAESILRAARKVGVRFYRFGSAPREKDVAAQIREARAKLGELVSLNQELGLCGIYQNHSASESGAYLGGDVSELREIVRGFDPSAIGVAFDIGHAIRTHGDGWRSHFEGIKDHLAVAYIKDVRRGAGWVPFGQGEIAGSGYFDQLRQLKYRAPYCLHIEYDWSGKGRQKTRAALTSALKESGNVIRAWAKG